ncbi:unnamed protein product, partial [Polarella glacialis]
FGYLHPLRGTSDTFTVKALAIGGSLAIHAASSAPGADLLSLTLNVDKAASDNDPVSVAARAKEWQEKVAVGVAQRLLSRQNSTARLGKALEASSSGIKRPAPEARQDFMGPDFIDQPDRFRPGYPGDLPPNRGDPFTPGFLGRDRPVLWTPDGGLLGPRHPAWGQVVPGRMGGGMMP